MAHTLHVLRRHHLKAAAVRMQLQLDPQCRAHSDSIADMSR
jgi:hypothetical protein